MRDFFHRTTRLKLALIGIPLMECLVLVGLGMLLFGGGKSASDPASDSREGMTEAAADEAETVVEIDLKPAPQKWLDVSLSTDGILRYSPVLPEPPQKAYWLYNGSRDLPRADVMALWDFSEGSLSAYQENRDAIMLAKLLYGEARGIDSEAEKAAVAWCVLNRVDDARFPDTVEEVITQPNQFEGYAKEHPVQSNLYLLAVDVLSRWEQEKWAGRVAGRVLPKEYCYFTGDGKHNFFSDDVRCITVWDWSYPDPYPAIRRERMQRYIPSGQEVNMIANVIYGVSQDENYAERRAVVWCILNRVSSGLFPDTVSEVIAERKQFPAYRDTNMIRAEDITLVREVITQWHGEMNGGDKDAVNRILPANYYYFDGNGYKNYFSKTYPVRYGYVFIADQAYLKARW